MSQQPFCQLGFPLSPLTQFEQLFFNATAMTTLSACVFSMISFIDSDRAFAVEAATNDEQTSMIHQSNQDPLSVSTLAVDLVDSSTVQLREITSFDCLVSVHQSERQLYAERSSTALLTAPTLSNFNSWNVPVGATDRPLYFNSEPIDRLTLFKIRF